MTPQEMVKTLATALADKQAREVRVLEVTDLTILADFFIIATATSTTHLRTLSDICEMTMKDLGEPPRHVEGHAGANWVLLDFGVVVVHLFLQETRAFYSLDRLWSDAKVWSEADL